MSARFSRIDEVRAVVEGVNELNARNESVTRLSPPSRRGAAPITRC